MSNHNSTNNLHISDWAADTLYSETAIDPKHLEEWRSSAISDEISNLNIESTGGYALLARLAPSEILEASPGVASLGDIRKTQYQYDHIIYGSGWWFSGLDPLNNWLEMEWGCCKPDNPRIDLKKNKPRKYEHPGGIPTRAFFLRVPPSIGKKIADRYGLEAPESGKFWPWVLENKLPVNVVEGVKKAASVLSAGFVAVGISSHTAGYRVPRINGRRIGKPYLIPELKIFKENPIYICLDEDEKPKTIESVNNSRSVYGVLFLKQGCEVKICNWSNTLGKGIDDVHFSYGVEQVEKIIASAKSFKQWQISNLYKLTYPADINVNCRYLGEQVDLTKIDAQLIGLLSVKGTGKTEVIKPVIKDVHNSDGAVIVLNHRNQLGEDVANRWGIWHINQIKNDIEASREASHYGFVACFESLHPNSQIRFKAEHWVNAKLVVLDEVEQSIFALLNSSTCDEHRVAILRELRTLLRGVIANGGKIVISDADLSDITINLIREIIGLDISYCIVQNHWRPGKDKSWKIYDYKSEDALLGSLESAIRNGEKVFVFTASQKAKSRWSTKNLESYMRKKFPDLKIIRIDGESIIDENHPAFGCMGNLNVFLKDYQIVICSPSIETGVSLEMSKYYEEKEFHFNSVWAMGSGIQSVNGFLQVLARVRENVPRHIYVTEFGLPGAFVGSGGIKASHIKFSEKKKFKVLMQQLRAADKDWEPDLNEDEDEDESRDLNIFYRCWEKMGARHNLGMMMYKQFILEYLRMEGHTVINADAVPSKDIQEFMKFLCEYNYYKERCGISEIEGFSSEDEYKKSKDSKIKTQDNLWRERKWEIEKRYLTDTTPELIEKDDLGWYKQLQLHYYCTTGKEFLVDRDKELINSLLAKGNGTLWIPTANQKSLIGHLALLEASGIAQLIRSYSLGHEFYNTHFDLVRISEFLEKVGQNDIKDLTGVKVPMTRHTKHGEVRTTPIQRIQPLVNQFGVRLQYTGRRTKNDERERLYCLHLDLLVESIPDSPEKEESGSPEQKSFSPILEDGRKEIFASWYERDSRKSRSVSDDDTKNVQQNP